MSTRATITVADERDHFDIYQHHDGYPDGPHGLVRHLKAAERRAWDLPRFEAADFAAAIIATLKDRGGSTYLTEDAAAHEDRAYHYRVSPLRDATCTRVGVTISESNWDKPDREIFSGGLDEAVERFDARPETEPTASVFAVLDTAIGALGRAEEEIGQWRQHQSDDDTKAVLDDLNGACLDLEALRSFLQLAEPWQALAEAESALADFEAAQRKGLVPGAKARVFSAMDACRQYQRRSDTPLHPALE